MELTDPKQIQLGKFDKAIDICTNQEGKLKNNAERKKKYSDAKAKFADAKKALEELIDKSKEIKMKSEGEGAEGQSFYNKFIGEGKDKFVTFAWLSQKLAEQGENVTDATKSKIDEMNFNIDEIDTSYDFIDITKKYAGQLKQGKGISKWLSGGLIGAVIGEATTRGITKFLVKDGLIKESMGLFGLGKLGITQGLPNLWGVICTGASTLWNFSPLMVVAGCGALAIKAIPVISKFVENVKKKRADNRTFENGIEDMLKEQEREENPLLTHA